MPARASKKRAITASTAEDSNGGAKRTRRNTARGRGRQIGKRSNHEETQMGAGTSQTQDLTDDPGLLKYEIPDQLTLAEAEEPNLSRTCTVCSSFLKPVLDTAGHTMSLLQCPQCPAAQPVCEQCHYPCSYISSGKSTATCTNKSCHLVATLLSCDLVTDPSSKVKGCPLFRACPKCHSLMMHERGCKYIACQQCRHRYCFICLQSAEECAKDAGKYWSLTCSNPRAARQRFQT